MNKIKVGITGTGCVVGQAIIKSLKKSNLGERVDIVGFDYVENTAGSCWVQQNYLLPDCFRGSFSENVWLDGVTRILKKGNVKVLLVGIEFELPLFAKFRQVIESQTGCIVVVSNTDIINTADDKYLTYKFLKENRFYYPQTLLPEDLTEKNAIMPCFLKPRKGTSSKGVFYIERQEDLDKRLPCLHNHIIQEAIGDENEEYTCGVILFDNEVKRSIVLNRELKNGDTITATYSKDTPRAIYDYIHKVALKLNPYGSCNFQLRLDKKGVPKIFEINARHSGSTYIRALFGYNEVEYILSYLLGLEIPKLILKEGMVKRYYEEQYIAV